MRLTSWTFLVPLWFSIQYFFFIFFFHSFFFHLPTELRISYLVQLHFHSWSMYKIDFFFIIFALCLLYYNCDKLQYAKSKVMRHFKRSLMTLNFRKYNKNTFIFFLHDQFSFLECLPGWHFPQLCWCLARYEQEIIFFNKKHLQQKPTHLQSSSWPIVRLESDGTFHSLGGFSIRDHPYIRSAKWLGPGRVGQENWQFCWC